MKFLIPARDFDSSSLLIASVMLLAPVCLAGQRLIPVPASANLFHSVRPSFHYTNDYTQSRRPLPRTFWLEGGVIGGIAMGVVTVQLGRSICESDCGDPGRNLAGFLLGGGLGLDRKSVV